MNLKLKRVGRGWDIECSDVKLDFHLRPEFNDTTGDTAWFLSRFDTTIADKDKAYIDTEVFSSMDEAVREAWLICEASTK